MYLSKAEVTRVSLVTSNCCLCSLSGAEEARLTGQTASGGEAKPESPEIYKGPLAGS